MSSDEWNNTMPASFCEGKMIPYLVPNVYEFFSAFSGAVLIFMGIFGILQPRLEMIIKMTYAGIVVSGLGTMMMHWKRIEIFNLADTFPLLVTLAFGLTAFFDTLITVLKVRRYQSWRETSLALEQEMMERQEELALSQQPLQILGSRELLLQPPRVPQQLPPPQQHQQQQHQQVLLQLQQQQQQQQHQEQEQESKQQQQGDVDEERGEAQDSAPQEASQGSSSSSSAESSSQGFQSQLDDSSVPGGGWRGTFLVGLESFVYIAMLLYLVTGLILVVYSTFDNIFGFYFGVPYGFFAIGGTIFLHFVNPHRADPIFRKLIPVMSLAIILGLLSAGFKLVDTDACNHITVWLFPHALFHILVTYSAHCFLVCLSFHRVYQATLGIGLKPDLVWKGFVFPYLVLPPTDAINLSVMLKKNLSETYDLMARNRMATILTV